jgi:hypothetical protein
MNRTTPQKIAKFHGFAGDLLVRVVSCWFWARQVLLLFYRLEAVRFVEEVKRLTL